MSTPNRAHVLRGTFVHTLGLGGIGILHDYLLVTDVNGFNIHFAPASDASSLPFTGHSNILNLPAGSFVLPPFVDLHLHAPQFLYQGTGLDLPLMEWLNAYAFKAEERIDSDPQLARLVYAKLAERLCEKGTGAVCLFGTINPGSNLILAQEMHKVGIRAFVGKLSMDISTRPTYVEPSAEASLEAAHQFISALRSSYSHLPAHERLVEPVITPRFIPTCSDELLTGLGTLARKEKVKVQSHMSESYDEVQWVQNERSDSDINIFSRSGLLTSESIFAHCTYLNPHPEMQHMHSAGASIAHCPLSNTYFSSGRPLRLREALGIQTSKQPSTPEKKLKVGLGSDIAGGYDIDIMGGMRYAVAISRDRQGRQVNSIVGSKPDSENVNLAITWIEALYLSTVGGAEALNLPNRGKFEVGAAFDGQLISLFDANTGRGVGPLDFLDVESGVAQKIITLEMIEKWWCVGNVSNREAMWVQGKKVFPF